MGPGRISIIAGSRSVGPFAYANPFNGGLMGWIGDPTNTWDIISYALAALILVTAVWYIDGAVTFFETRFKTAFLAAIAFLSVLLVLAQGGKFHPFEWRELIAASLFALAFFATCGRVFAITADQKKEGAN